MKFVRKSAGFTLLELLVVIGIIALLIATATASYSTVQKKARDSKRKTDLKNIANALEQYYSVCGFVYPAPADGPDAGAAANEVPSTIVCTTPSPDVTIMSTVPTDPSTSAWYSMSGSGSDYSICAPNLPSPLELEPGPYCLKNQQ